SGHSRIKGVKTMLNSTSRQRVARFQLAATLALSLASAAALTWSARAEAAAATTATAAAKPTVVLVHGAFADAASWEGVTAKLLAKGYPVIAAANPLRGLGSDAAYVGAIVDNVGGPVVLVGHSYGGAVITNAANGKANVKGLVYVAGFAPEAGESAF